MMSKLPGYRSELEMGVAYGRICQQGRILCNHRQGETGILKSSASAPDDAWKVAKDGIGGWVCIA